MERILRHDHATDGLPRKMSELEDIITSNTKAGRPTIVRPSDRPTAKVSAAFLADLLRSRTYSDQSVVVIGATVIGRLDCSDIEITAPIRFLACAFNQPIIFSRARIDLFDLRRSTMPGLVIERATVKHDLLLRRVVVKPTGAYANAINAQQLHVSGSADFSFLCVKGTVSLPGATIGGQLIYFGATLSNPNGDALIMDQAEVKGSILFAKGFTAEGTVSLLGATIGAQLRCFDAKLSNPNGDALIMDGAEVKGDLIFAEGFTAEGTVRLLGATIGGQLRCFNATLSNPDGNALIMDQAEVKGGIFFAEGFTAEGTVRLPGATIGSQLRCLDATLSNPDGNALTMDQAEVKGGIFFAEGFTAKGTVSILGATIGAQLICLDATLSNPNRDALIMNGAEVKGGIFFAEGFTAEGTVRLPGTTIGGQLRCSDTTLSNPNGDALIMDQAEVKGGIIFTKGFTAKGTVSILGATIGGQLRCSGATLSNPDGNALIMDGAEVKGDILLDLAYADSEEPRVFRLSGTHFGRLRLVFVEECHSEAAKLNTVLALEGATYGGLYVEDTSSSVSEKHSFWVKRCQNFWTTIRGTRQLQQNPGKLYRSILIDQQRLPENEIYPATYTTVAQVLRDAGNEQLAKELLIEKNRQLTKERPIYVRPFSWLLDITVGYGYRPRLAILWALAVYLGAVALFSVAVHHHGIVATPLFGTTGSPTPLHSISGYPTFSSWNYAFGALLVPFVHLPGVDAWRANAINGWGSAVRVVRWIEPVVLWALLLTLGATFTWLITRDRR